MDREFLRRSLEEGKSLLEVGRETGCHPSTVGYWAGKYGITPAGAAKYAPRGAPDRAVIETLASRGATLAEIAQAVDRSVATVRHGLKRWDISRADVRKRAFDPTTAPRLTERQCPSHGRTSFVLDGRGTYRCKRCRQERVAGWRRRVKRILVEEAGGCCSACGYARCLAALQFHHLDPEAKLFTVSGNGVTRSLARVRLEAAKCVLLCANCHAEVEAGVRPLEAA